VNVTISLEHRFDRTPDGAVWTSAAFPHSFYRQYLDVYDAVRVVARVRNVATEPRDGRRADGPGVSFEPVPCYVGPRQFLMQMLEVRRAARNAVAPAQAVILRVASQVASALQPFVHRGSRPYGLEVVGDPYDAFAPGCMQHPLRPLFRVLFYHRLKRQCAAAPAVAYVTEQALQNRYPAAPDAFVAAFSDVELRAEAFITQPRSEIVEARPIHLLSVGSLEQLYKGPDVLIDATAKCIRQGLNLTLTFIGDGRYRGQLQTRAESLGSRVRFLGQVPAGPEIRARLDDADLFVLPSRSEGLPRAMVEAMARALPCIGSAVGGIPELLMPDDLVPAGNTEALAQKIQEVAGNPARMRSMSARNLKKSREYRDELLSERRNRFYQYIKQRTAAWLTGRRPPEDLFSEKTL
jgi:glycosyltransferase involved in cell wall biosynthesis